MWEFKTGDLIAKHGPRDKKPIQVGIVIKENKHTFTIKWLWYDKIFYMEKSGAIFQNLNKEFLLNIEQYHRNNTGPLLYVINDSYIDGN